MNGISYHSLDPEILSLMRQAGFRDLNLSLVSADDRSLAAANRPHTLPKFLETVEQAHSLDFRIVAYQIIGLPFESRDMMVRTMALLARLPVLLGVSIFYLTPGCPISRDFPFLNDSDVFKARSTAMAIETKQFCRHDLYTFFITGRIINFLKGIKTGNGRASLKDTLELAGRLGKRARIGADLLGRLLGEKKLHAATAKGYIHLPRFRSDLFFEVLKEAGLICTREGGVIRLPEL